MLPGVCADSRLADGLTTRPSDYTQSIPGDPSHNSHLHDEGTSGYGTSFQSYVAGYSDLFLGDIGTLYSDIDSQNQAKWDLDYLAAPTTPDTTAPCLDPAMFYTPTHLPTILIQFWFSDVCPMWCIFDSDANYNRRFVYKSWASSEAVYFAVQSMSAACMLDTLPTLTPVLSSLTTKALTVIRSQVSSFWATARLATLTIPADLLFAIFAMGTSLHWKFGYELGGSLIKDAQCIIGHYKGKLPVMSVSDRKHLAYFQKALICWEGLLCAADRDFTPISLTTRRDAHRSRIRADLNEVMPLELQFGPSNLPMNELELHPWCGVSSEVLQKFGQVMSLCHLARRRRESIVQDVELELRCDTGVARELASELKMMNFNVDSHWINTGGLYTSTNDSDTPITHLLDIAEAYRQACFLQLCLTFDEIPIDDSAHPGIGIPTSSNEQFGNQIPPTRVQRLIVLSLRLTEQLKKIPAESGSRCMQPILYLCAACGLQIDSPPQFQDPTDNQEPDFAAATFTLSALKVIQARSFVKKRLGILQQLLPPRYTGTALRLAEAIWAEYDRTAGGGSPLYWFDVMVREKLQTFFG